MANADTLREAVLECFRAHPGAELTISQVDGWIKNRYPDRWKDASTAVADLTLNGNTSSGYRPSDRFLERVGRGVYRLTDSFGRPESQTSQTRQAQTTNEYEKSPVGRPPAIQRTERVPRSESFWIPGIPSVWASAAEAPWRERLAHHIRPAGPSDQSHQGVQLRLSLEADTRAGQPFDLDNLCEPVFRVLVSEHGFFGGKRPTVQWWTATKRVESPPGCRITLDVHPQRPHHSGRLLFQGVYRGEFPHSASETRVAEWLQDRGVELGSGGALPFAVSLVFGSARVNIADVATGPAKPIIDNLFPLIGGRVSHPDDWRIQSLFVAKGHDGMDDDQFLLSIMTVESIED